MSATWAPVGEAALPLVDTLSSSRSLLSTSGFGLPLPPSDLRRSRKKKMCLSHSDLTNDRQRWLCLHDIQHGKLTRKLFCYYSASIQFAMSHSRLTSLATGISSGQLSVFTFDQITEQMSFLFRFFFFFFTEDSFFWWLFPNCCIKDHE